MQSTEGREPPPPTPTNPSPPEKILRTGDNPMALAGLMVSVLGLVLSLVVIGGFLGLAGIGLSAVGMRRSRSLGGSGRLLAIGGAVLGVIAIGFSVLGFFWISSLVDSTNETTVIDGIRSNSSDVDHPPQDDVDGIDCGSSNTGLLAQATVTITNRSDDDTRYVVTVEWDTEDGSTVTDQFTTDTVDVGETESFSTIELTGAGLVDTCRVVEINRPTFSLLS